MLARLDLKSSIGVSAPAALDQLFVSRVIGLLQVMILAWPQQFPSVGFIHLYSVPLYLPSYLSLPTISTADNGLANSCLFVSTLVCRHFMLFVFRMLIPM